MGYVKTIPRSKLHNPEEKPRNKLHTVPRWEYLMCGLRDESGLGSSFTLTPGYPGYSVLSDRRWHGGPVGADLNKLWCFWTHTAAARVHVEEQPQCWIKPKHKKPYFVPRPTFNTFVKCGVDQVSGYWIWSATQNLFNTILCSFTVCSGNYSVGVIWYYFLLLLSL